LRYLLAPALFLDAAVVHGGWLALLHGAYLFAKLSHFVLLLAGAWLFCRGKETANLTLENQILTVRGEKKQVAVEKTTTVHRYERSYGVFERTFSLPNTVDSDRVQAAFEHGVLRVVLPKAEKAKARSIEVKVGS